MEQNKPLKLLIVDDEPTIVEFTQKIYQKQGYTTLGATDGITAVNLYQKERPDVSLIDIHMPFSEIDGVETLRRIKEIDKNAVCIMVTRITEKDKVADSKKYGASAYVLKPLDLEDLDRAIEEALNKK